MAKIISPNTQYSGISASVTFINGVGDTSSPHLIEWFKEHGYTVEEEVKEHGYTVEEEVKEPKKKAAAKDKVE